MHGGGGRGDYNRTGRRHPLNYLSKLVGGGGEVRGGVEPGVGGGPVGGRGGVFLAGVGGGLAGC